MTAQTSALQHIKNCKVEGNHIILPNYQIPPAEYTQVKRALEGICGLWSRSHQAFVFDSTPRHHFDRLCQGEQINLPAEFKKKTQFFYTPEAVLDLMHEYFYIGAGYRVFEPSGGEGHICDYLLKKYPTANYEWSLDVCEKEPIFQTVLRQKGYNVVHDDLMTMKRPERGYNLIVANPPFRGDQDMLHIMKMYSMLAPGGRLVSLMRYLPYIAESAVTRKFRAFLDDIGFYTEEKVPAGAFKESGTSIATQFVVLDMPLY